MVSGREEGWNPDRTYPNDTFCQIETPQGISQGISTEISGAGSTVGKEIMNPKLNIYFRRPGTRSYYCIRVCEKCGGKFQSNKQSGDRRYCTPCSRKIAGNGKRLKGGLTVKCKRCGKEFYKFPSERRSYCSKSCAYLDRRKYKRRKYSCKNCGKVFESSDRPHSNNSNNFCSIECRNKSYENSMGGSLNPNWRGGTHSPGIIRQRDRGRKKNRVWSKAVLERDGNTCRICGKKSKRMEAHHIISWLNKELRYELSNGISLCRPCHFAAHGKEYHRGSGS